MNIERCVELVFGKDSVGEVLAACDEAVLRSTMAACQDAGLSAGQSLLIAIVASRGDSPSVEVPMDSDELDRLVVSGGVRVG